MSLEPFFDNNGNFSKTGQYTIYDLELRVFNSLNQFNSVYAQYLRCSQISDQERSPVINQIMNNNHNKKDCFSTPSINDVTREYNNVIQNKEAYTNAYNYIQEMDKSSVSNTPINMVDLENNYNQLLKLRNELDMKTMELNKNKKSEFIEFKQQYDSTIYIEILVTILCVSIIYYTFRHI